MELPEIDPTDQSSHHKIYKVLFYFFPRLLFIPLFIVSRSEIGFIPHLKHQQIPYMQVLFCPAVIELS